MADVVLASAALGIAAANEDRRDVARLVRPSAVFHACDNNGFLEADAERDVTGRTGRRARSGATVWSSWNENWSRGSGWVNVMLAALNP